MRKTIYFAYAELYVLYNVYTFAYSKTYTSAKHIVLHMQKYMFCITYEKLYILNKKRRTFHEEALTTKIITDSAFVFLRMTTCIFEVLHVEEVGIRIHQRCVEYYVMYTPMIRH